MTMWKLKGCPRCNGDIFIDSDLEGWYEQCLQCSYKRRLKDINQFTKEPGKIIKSRKMTKTRG